MALNLPTMMPSFTGPLPVHRGDGRRSGSLALDSQDCSTSEAFPPRTVLTENICRCVQQILQHFTTKMPFVTTSRITFSCLASVAPQADCWWFGTARALPSLHVLPDTIDMCRAAENTSGRGSFRGSQRIRWLWRIYPRWQEARDKLLLGGMNLWGTQVSLLPKNPFTLQDQNSEKPATKLWVGNVPMTVDDNVIETALKKLGCEMRSTVRKELARDKNGKLTKWETGRRFVFITVPATPLPKLCTMGIFSAELYHREMKEKRDENRKKCANCLLPDHAAATCTNPVVCLTCFRPGHRRSECHQPLSGTRSDPADLDQERGETPDTISPDPPQAPPPSPPPPPPPITQPWPRNHPPIPGSLQQRHLQRAPGGREKREKEERKGKENASSPRRRISPVAGRGQQAAAPAGQ